MNIGGRIKEIRKQSGIKITELAEKAGIARVYLSDIERGKHTPSLKTLEAICAALKVSLSAFFAEEGQGLDPEFRKMVDTAKKLTPEQRESLQKLMETMNKD
jgi:HTH-type transcriptional repressor of puuD